METGVRILGPRLELEETLVSFPGLTDEKTEAKKGHRFCHGLRMALESHETGYGLGQLTETR